MNQILRAEFAGTVFGVPGRFYNVIGEPGASTVASQTFTTETRPCPSYGEHATICAKLRFDDECRNGHNSFAITADIRDSRYRGSRGELAGGCCHEEIAAAFPELAPLIRWHLTSSDGPMHYIANTVYHAGNRDHWGKLAGEPRQWSTLIQFGANPIKHKPGSKFVKWLESCVPLHGEPRFDFEVLPFYHGDNGKPGKHQFGPKYTFGGFADKWHECPFDSESEALDFLCALQTCQPQFIKVATAWGEGKPRDLDAARRSAVWPDASDAELSVEPDELKAALVKRHSHLMRAFREDMESAGFIWTDSDTPARAA
jgi:hypothetical protein